MLLQLEQSKNSHQLLVLTCKGYIIKATQLIENLNKIIKEHGDLEICYSIDDEGNGYEEVHFSPSIGILEEYDTFITENISIPTHICIN